MVNVKMNSRVFHLQTPCKKSKTIARSWFLSALEAQIPQCNYALPSVRLTLDHTHWIWRVAFAAILFRTSSRR